MKKEENLKINELIIQFKRGKNEKTHFLLLDKKLNLYAKKIEKLENGGNKIIDTGEFLCLVLKEPILEIEWLKDLNRGDVEWYDFESFCFQFVPSFREKRRCRENWRTFKDSLSFPISQEQKLVRNYSLLLFRKLASKNTIEHLEQKNKQKTTLKNHLDRLEYILKLKPKLPK